MSLYHILNICYTYIWSKSAFLTLLALGRALKIYKNLKADAFKENVWLAQNNSLISVFFQ